ncbi:MAG: hypothetical protein LBV41_02075 [Cytophagaceae bacterium]|jgi:magnesium-transporting ATPase (P-type)|nr:hypothetical protein [Cytophagaceae bacterium]
MTTENVLTEKDLTNLVSRLKKEDSRYSFFYNVLRRFYLIIISMLAILFTINVLLNEQHTIAETVGKVCMLASLLIFALLMNRYYRLLKSIDYSQRTLAMLKAAARRYRLFNADILWCIPALLLLDTYFYTKPWLSSYFLLFQIFFWGIMAVSFVTGVIIWYKRLKPLRDAALQMIAEMEHYEGS